MVSAPRELPASLPPGQGEAVQDYTRTICEVASVRGVARVDFLANDHELFVNEVNTIPARSPSTSSWRRRWRSPSC